MERKLLFRSEPMGLEELHLQSWRIEERPGGLEAIKERCKAEQNNRSEVGGWSGTEARG